MYLAERDDRFGVFIDVVDREWEVQVGRAQVADEAVFQHQKNAFV